MEINVSAQNYSTLTQGQSRDNAVQFPSSQLSVQQQTNRQNLSILEKSYEVTLQSGNNSQALVYKAAIEQINEILAPDLGERPLDSALESGLDVSPEAVADRIVAMTTGMFGNYLDSHPELSEEAALERFMNLIGEGITRGFEEAREILDSLSVLEGDIASNIDQTYELTIEGLEAFSLSFGFEESNFDTNDYLNYSNASSEPEIIGDDSLGDL